MADTGPEEPSRYQFDDLTLDTGQRLVSRGEDAIEVSGLTFDLLRVLVESAPNIVTHDELAEKVWGGRPVSPETISQRAMMLRQALDDNAKNPRYFDVVRGHGYRLLPAVRIGAIPPGHLGKKRNYRYPAIASVLAIFAISLFYWVGPGDRIWPIISDSPSVAVLPFESLNPAPDEAYFAIGIHAEVLNELSRVDSLSVTSRSTVRDISVTDRPISEIAKQLNVDAVLEGNVLYSGDKVNISVWLTDGVSGAQIWSEGFERSLKDIFAVQHEIAIRVAESLNAELADSEAIIKDRTVGVSPDAQAYYLRVLGAFTDPHLAIQYLDIATELDPTFAPAFGLKAWQYSQLLRFVGANSETAAELESHVHENAERALDLDSSVMLAHVALATLFETAWQWPEAQLAYEAAYRINSRDSRVLNNYARFCRLTGHHQKSIELLQEAIELEPGFPGNRHGLGVAFLFAKNYSAANEAFEAALSLNPTLAQSHLEIASIAIIQGDNDKAIRELRVTEQLLGNAHSVNFYYARLAMAYARLGLPEDANRIFKKFAELSETRYVDLSYWVLSHIAIGEYDLAYKDLTQAISQSRKSAIIPLIEIKFNIWNEPILNEPRFRNLREQIGST